MIVQPRFEGEGLENIVVASMLHGANSIRRKIDEKAYWSLDSVQYDLEYFTTHYDNIAGLSILGGEPLADQNVIDVAWLTTAFKQRFPDKTVWLWTGYAWDKVKSYPVMLNIDVCVAGPFDISKRDLSLKWCGSSNQQVIDVHASLICNKPILYKGVVI